MHLCLSQSLLSYFPGLRVSLQGTFRTKISDRRIKDFDVLRAYVLLHSCLIWPNQRIHVELPLLRRWHTLSQEEFAIIDQVDMFSLLSFVVHCLPSNQLLLFQIVLKTIKLLRGPEREEGQRLEEHIHYVLVFLLNLEDESLVIILTQ